MPWITSRLPKQQKEIIWVFMHISGQTISKGFICISVLNEKQTFAVIQKKERKMLQAKFIWMCLSGIGLKYTAVIFHYVL